MMAAVRARQRQVSRASAADVIRRNVVVKTSTSDRLTVRTTKQAPTWTVTMS